MASDTSDTKTPEDQGGKSSPSGDEALLPEPSRRAFFKRAAVGGGAVLLAGGAAYGVTQAAIRGRPVDDVDEFIKTDDTFKPKDQRDVVLTFAVSAKLSEQHPERNEQYSKLNGKQFHFHETATHFEHRLPWDNSKPGYTQKDRALHHAAWYPLDASNSHSMAFGQPDTPMFAWDQSDVEKEQYQFKSKQEAAASIKSAARVWGAVRCGITKRDRRWDYDPIYDILNERTLTWEEDFPFEPKTVIVMLTGMDYDAIATAPAWTAEGTIGDGYSMMGKVANQMAKFIRGMGYHAVASGNDLGSSVAYAVMAGLGESGRHGQLMAPGIGPRCRICKVYTDFEFVEYDKPHDWGMTEFCLSCGECAKACPSGALPLVGDVDGGFGYAPTYEHSDQPGYTWSNHVGVRKFYVDSKKCYDFWIENDSSCGNCIAACTYNEPDYWHHWMSMAATGIVPSFLHGMMSHMHPLFGYGGTDDPAKVDKFWETGEGMRVNPGMKNNIGTSNKA